MKGWPGEPQMQYDVLIEQEASASAHGKPITDVIFDFGNVLVYWDPEAVFIPRYSQHTIDQFLDNDITGFYDINDFMDDGASVDEGVARMRAEHGDKWADMFQYYVDNFEDSITGVVPGARVLISDLQAAGIGVWGLSNWQKDLYAVAEDNCAILRMLQAKIVSGFVKLRKPGTAIYERALSDFNIQAESSIFIDDKAMNIVGANKAGIRGIRFSDPRCLREQLIEAGVDIPPMR